MTRISLPFVCILFLFGLATRSFALGTEEFGNKPLIANNYPEWPDLMPVINAETRAYSNWVNGNENFYFKGGTRELNAALNDFAATRSDFRQVTIRPGPGEAHSFGGKKIPFDWQLNIHSGISKHTTNSDKGELVWNKSPALTIYLGDGIELQQLKIPDGITLVSIAQRKMQCADAISNSSDKTVRGWGCAELAHLDLYDDESVKAIEARLLDNDDWVRSNAAGALALFGARAKPTLITLRQVVTSSHQRNLRERAIKAITTIEGGC